MKFLNNIIKCGLLIVILGLATTAFAEEEPWGMEYIPVVITWYGEHVPRFKHELESFKILGAAAIKPEHMQDCEDKVESVRKAFLPPAGITADKHFHSIVLCFRRAIEKPPEPVKEKK